MADSRRFGIRFTRPPNDNAPSSEPAIPERHDRVPVYQLALAFTARVFAVIECAAEAERYFLRDQLDRKSAIIPQLIAQGLALADMPARRALYLRARELLTDCATILDMLSERQSVVHEVLAPARRQTLELLDLLLELTAPPPRVW
jgi:23S rRNA-intervening sequence protein